MPGIVGFSGGLAGMCNSFCAETSPIGAHTGDLSWAVCCNTFPRRSEREAREQGCKLTNSKVLAELGDTNRIWRAHLGGVTAGADSRGDVAGF
jgi:hypothetical protein